MIVDGRPFSQQSTINSQRSTFNILFAIDLNPSQLPSIKAVLFDFDGVIVHSEPLHLRAFQLVAGGEGIELTADEYYRDLIGYDDRGAWRALYQLRGLPLDRVTFDRLLSAKAAAANDLMSRGEFHALPGAAAFIMRLASRQIPMAICSGALRDEIETMLCGIGLRQHFPVIVAAEDVEVGKPDPSGYLLAMKRLGDAHGCRLSPGDCLIIEDAPSVSLRASEAGFNVLGVTTTFPAEGWPASIRTAASLSIADVAAALPEWASDLVGVVR